MSVVLGISAFYHDSAAAIVRDGQVVAAAQEERFSRKKADAGFPRAAVRYCLEAAGVQSVDALDAIAFYDKPLATFERLLETYFAFAPRGFGSFLQAVPTWVEDKLLLRGRLVREVQDAVGGTVDPARLRFDYHHHSHAASAFLPSPFRSAAVLVMDGVGEWATTTIGHGRDGHVELLRELRFPHSIGLLYAAFTYYLGFKVNDGEYKVMGLAPYGAPRFADRIREKLVDLREDGSLRLDMRYFAYCTGLTMTGRAFEEVMGHPRREPGAPLEQVHMDMAASVQAVTEEGVLRLARTARLLTGERQLCLAGGVALNCVANGKLVRAGVFDDVWIQPAAGDAGGALGAALAVAYADGAPRVAPQRPDGMRGALLGPSYGREEIRRALDARRATYEDLSPEAAVDAAAEALAREQIVGWFQGRMEFGPRSLGSRSILGDARSPRMQSVLNLKIKYRESFRPFAPAVLREQVGEYFELDGESPYMLLVAPVRADRRRPLADEERAATGLARLRQVRSDIPAVTHVDYSARIQTVDEAVHPRFHRLLSSFREKTGCGVIVNTSFNVRDEPIVCSPDDAYRCFMGTEMDILVLDTFVLRKERQ